VNSVKVTDAIGLAKLAAASKSPKKRSFYYAGLQQFGKEKNCKSSSLAAQKRRKWTKQMIVRDYLRCVHALNHGMMWMRLQMVRKAN
jgi:hypothetical protein